MGFSPQPRPACLTDGRLSVDGYTLLEAAPETLGLVADPLGHGVFLSSTQPEAAARHCIALGTIPGLVRYTCCHRYDPWWMTPAMGTRGRDIPIETQFLLAELSSGQYLMVMPLLDGPFRCALQGREDDTLVLVAQSGDPAIVRTEITGVLLALGDDPYTLVSRAAESAVARMQCGRLRREKSLPPFIDLFGWCTWDAFYEDVSCDKVRLGLQSFVEGGICPRTMILDDGWLSTRTFPTGERRLTSLTADPAKFPGGLGEVTRLAKEEFGLDYFFVWHTLQGYWGGVDPAQFPQYHVLEEARGYSPEILQLMAEGNNAFGPLCGVVEPDSIHRFYQDFYRQLRQQGVDGVKVDNQSAMEGIARGLGGRVNLARVYHEALEGAAHTHFRGQVINCMSQSNDILFNTLNSTVTRSFTDFWPKKPESHGLHLFANAHNGFWMGEFIHVDWDMFQSAHPMGAYHAAGRAVSGGPIYVSDKPEAHNFQLLRKLVLSDGTTLRADGIGRPTRDCLFHNTLEEDRLLKVFNTNGDAGVLGVFNARYHAEETERVTITDQICPSDVEGMAGDAFAVYFHTTGQLRYSTRQDRFDITLPEGGYEIVTIVPIADGFAPIGLADKFNSAAALTGKGLSAQGGYAFSLRDGGDVRVWCAQAPTGVLVDGTAHAFTYDAASHALALTIATDGVHEVRLLG